MYEITGDLIGLKNLLDTFVDEEGNPREPTADEIETMKEWFDQSEEDFKGKFDNYCKFIKNLQIDSEIAKAEKDAYKKEIDRLSRRSKAFENRSKSVKNLLLWAMEKLRLEKNGYKTSLFSAKLQNTQKSVVLQNGFNSFDIPREFLKAPELNTTAIKQALKDGVLIQKEGIENHGKVFYRNGNRLEGVSVLQGSALVIR